jgi:hypothetical protein
MFKLYAPAWLATLAYVVEGHPLRELESSRQFPAAADLSARLNDVLKQLPGEQRVVVDSHIVLDGRAKILRQY